MKAMHGVAFILVIFGALNWGLVGLFGVNLIETALGSMMSLVKVIYMLVGASAIYLVLDHKNSCRYCGMKGKKGK